MGTPPRRPRELDAVRPDPDVTATKVVVASDQPQRRMVLHVHLNEGSYVQPLPSHGTVRIGRHPGSDFLLRDPSVSREHAVLTIGDEISITDLGSRNGTRVGHSRVGDGVAAPLQAYQLFSIGDVVASIEFTPGVGLGRRVLHPPEFEAYLADTASLARRTGADLAIVSVAFEEVPDVDDVRSRIEEVLGTDCIARYGDRMFRALLSDIPVQVCEERSNQLRRDIEQATPRVRVRVQYLEDQTVGNMESNVDGPVIADEAMVALYGQIRQFAAGKISVLINGETGAGKENLAEAVHKASPRADRPFLKINCAALSDTLLESELFGHEKGSFTGASARKDGRFQIADGGTLFLDEIGEISPSIQVKLLRFLQEHEFERVGGNQTIRVDVRVIAASNRNLTEEVAKGRFREDLFYRLNVVSLEMPTLRDRRSDIPALSKFFLDRYTKENAKPIEGFTPETMDLLTGYDWPGNVRELENAIERAVVLTSGAVIEPRSLPTSIRPRLAPTGAPIVPGSTLGDIEKYAILETLKATGGSTSRAAEILGISVRTIQYRLHQYNEAPRSDIDVVQKSGAEEASKT